jgi:hypothetical protein
MCVKPFRDALHQFGLFPGDRLAFRFEEFLIMRRALTFAYLKTYLHTLS